MPRANYNFFTKFPLFTFPKAWNNAGIVTHYSNFTTFKIALTEELLNNNNNTENLTPNSSSSLITTLATANIWST